MSKQRTKLGFSFSFLNSDKSVLGIDMTRGTMNLDDEPHHFIDFTIGAVFFFVMITLMRKKEGE